MDRSKSKNKFVFPKYRNTVSISELAQFIDAADSDFEIFSSDDENEIGSIISDDANKNDFVVLPPSTSGQNTNTIDSDHTPEEDVEFHDEAGNSISSCVVLSNSDGVIVDNVEFEVIDETVNFDRTYTFTPKDKIEWRRGLHPFLDSQVPFITFDYDESNRDDSPLSYFFKYFPIEFFDNASTYTNMYALQQGISAWKHTNSNELIKLFAIHILMGSLKLPRSKIYWSKDLGLDLVAKCMSFDRFCQLRTHLHFINNLEMDPANTDAFIKVRPVINSVRNRCLEFPLEQNLCVDEQIVPFKGQLRIKQYMKGKPCPWGIKIFLLCGKNGKPYDLVLYQGQSTEISQSEQKRFGFGAATVLHLIKRITATGHNLYFDNYFSTYQLFEILKARQINAVGTLRINRFANPPFITDKEIKKKPRGYSDEISSRDGKVVIVKWQDNRTVHIGSNCKGKGCEQTIKRWDKKTKTMTEIQQPEVICDYSQNMGGVDRLDQFISYYRIFLKSRKWTLRIVFHFVDLAVCSSWIEYKEDLAKNQGSEPMDLLAFRLYLVRALIDSQQVQKRGRPREQSDEHPSAGKVRKCEVRPVREVQWDTVNHFVEHDEKNEASRCKADGCKYKTFLFCRKCNVHLCINRGRNCFLEFHRK